MDGNELASPAEAFGGLTGHLAGVALMVGGSVGLNDHVGAAGWRCFAAVGYRLRWPRDDDRDGVDDSRDRCPLRAEDPDGHQDDDGCPDEDNDGDGLLDAADRCPMRAEDVDGFEDEDGCPDEDNDGDGLADREDQCPDDAEDRDGNEDEDGCPDRDNDGDGVPDLADRCPTEQERRNGFRDEDGCPDERPRYLFKKHIPLVLSGKLFRDGTDRLTRDGRELAAAVAESLRLQVDVRIRVEAHTDQPGSDAANLALSQERALAFMNALSDAGVEPGRLDYAGFGRSQPPAPGSRLTVERIELRVIAR